LSIRGDGRDELHTPLCVLNFDNYTDDWYPQEFEETAGRETPAVCARYIWIVTVRPTLIGSYSTDLETSAANELGLRNLKVAEKNDCREHYAITHKLLSWQLHRTLSGHAVPLRATNSQFSCEAAAWNDYNESFSTKAVSWFVLLYAVRQ
jgi:hypothetical protein